MPTEPSATRCETCQGTGEVVIGCAMVKPLMGICWDCHGTGRKEEADGR